MKIFKWEKVSESDRNFAFKELCINLLGPIVICILCFALIYTVISEISLLEDVGSSSFIKEKSGKVLLLFFFFPFSLFFLASIQKLLNYKSEYLMAGFVKGLFIALSLFFLLVIPFNLYVESYIKSNGYTYCNWYTQPSVRAPDVWLKNDELCLQDGSVITSDIYDWFEMHNEKRIEPTLNELEVFIQETRAEYNR
ncbi:MULTISPECIES: DUF1240 domain-containing protein [Pseudoalteromonas]|jgi:uncharacterized protein DUF1240|uniref:DUF1240 domain-containing protein n=2 Tax=Pseudoalteromonas TaxID=53246 RepID=A0AA37S437_9GAMM|nr:DUF1240 domain-containing protein [Pseudoalteromonas tetraodonis]ATD04718.1 hypothetical protein PTET_a3554 [Pseudoalteromonas tetraodonis]GEN40170.1 hypothetical protein PTE01_32800 [Pseudoalteromonas tetraodonis GFC]GLQ03907.1 hypothetical protein GCM10007914_27880 [Pseudoalteromonas tetraodonis GFC]